MGNHDELTIFCAVAETGGFSAAARRLQVTKSAVSKAVQKLEARLAARLLHRTTRKISLTEAGEAFYQHARRAVQEAQAATDAVASLSREPQGNLKLTAPMSIGLILLTDVVTGFLNRYPRMGIDLHLDDVCVDLVGGGYDLAIRTGTMNDSTMVARRIAEMPTVPVAAPSYLDRTRVPGRPEELAEHECLLFARAFPASEWQFSRDGSTRWVKVFGRYQVNSSIALRSAVLDGVGIGRIPEYLVRDDIAAGRLLRLLPDYTMDAQPVNVVFPEGRFIPAKARLFVEFAERALNQDLPPAGPAERAG